MEVRRDNMEVRRAVIVRVHPHADGKTVAGVFDLLIEG
jgi:hypothetical protein